MGRVCGTVTKIDGCNWLRLKIFSSISNWTDALVGGIGSPSGVESTMFQHSYDKREGERKRKSSFSSTLQEV